MKAISTERDWWVTKASKVEREANAYDVNRFGDRRRADDATRAPGNSAEGDDASVCADWPMDQLIDHVAGR